MKIINFDEFLPFKKIRQKMKIADDYKPNIKIVGAEIGSGIWGNITTVGHDIKLEDIKNMPDGTLEHKDFPGEKVIVYIRDHNIDFERYGEEISQERLPKFHMSWCRTLEQMKERKRYNRYVAAQNITGEFKINMISQNKKTKESFEKLNVCKNCLSRLNYNDYNEHKYDKEYKERVVKEFNLKDFLEKYNTNIKIKPRYNEGNQPLNKYSSNWDEISRKLREEKGWVCQDCHKDMNFYKKNLHVHHIDGVRSNNSYSNLEVVCLECHSKKPNHEHMKDD